VSKILGYRYVVSGFGAFPIDMFRYDQAWPAREEDAGRIHHTSDRSEFSTPYVIQVRGNVRPTIGRWSSFGWRVVSIEEVRS
jgi:hypothetical protein